MKILFFNAAEDATITASSVNTNYPASNLVHQFLYKVFKASAASTTISMVFSAPTQVNCMYIGYHNLASITITLFNASGTVIYTRTISNPEDIVTLHLDSLYSVSSIRIVATCAAGAVVRIGGVACGSELTLPYPDPDPTYTHTDNSSSSSSPNGQIVANYFAPLRLETFNFTSITGDEYSVFNSAYESIGIGAHLWADFYELSHSPRKPMYCIITEAPSFQREEQNKYSGSITFQEAR
jgi:hypothetical protein